MSSVRLLVTTAVAGALLALTGCASPPIEEEPAPSPPPVVEPSVTPAPTPTAPPRLPSVDELVITPAGIGSLLVGKPVSGTDMVVYDAEHCAEEYAQTEISADPGAWVPNYAAPEVGHALFDVIIVDNILQAIEINSPTLRTENGIGLGSSVEELTAAYPSLGAGHETDLSKSLVLATSTGEIVFEVMTGDLGDRFYPGNLVSMRIFPPGEADPGLRAGSDWGYWPC